jgi:tetratricopeptide (TPR) repeat protein
MEIIDFLRNQFVRDSMIGGFFIGLGQFCMFAANSTVLYAAKKYILKGEIDSEDMGLAMNVVMTAASGIGQGMGNIGDLKKAKNAFRDAAFYKPNVADYHYNLAYVYKKLGKEKDAKLYLDYYNKIMNNN